jgi:N-methylhydantoinase A
VELVTLRLRARMPSPRMAARAQTVSNGRITSTEKRRVWFSGRAIATAILAREQVAVSGKFSGPAIVTEYSGTTVITPRRQFSVDRAGNLMIEIQKQKAPTRGA